MNAFKRAGTGSPSPQRSANDLSAVTVNTPLTNAVEKTPIVEPDGDEDEVEFETNRRVKWKKFFQNLFGRIAKIWCPADREWTLTSIQVRFMLELFWFKVFWSVK